MISYYELFGIEPSATKGQIKTAFRKLMLLHHPDKHGHQGDPVSRIMLDAYSTLSDGMSRQNYNEMLEGRKTRASGEANRQEKGTRTSSQGCERCHDCSGYGYSKILGPRFGCRTCGEKGWVPGKKASPGKGYEPCRDCNEYGYSWSLGPRFGCRTCGELGWVPGRKF